MQWSDEGVILSVRPHGETAAVAEVFTRTKGRHLGLVHGGRSRRQRPVLQLGNHVDLGWKARISDQLGHFSMELRRGYAAAAMNNPATLAALTSLCSLLRLFPERDPHPNLYEITQFVLGFFDDNDVWPALMVRWEVALLKELGFGLDLEYCAATGETKNLIYVSPKSGRAVSAEAGAPYKDKMLALPGFLAIGRDAPVKPKDIADGFTLTAHFLQTRVLQPRDQQLPDSRERMIALLTRKAPQNAQ